MTESSDLIAGRYRLADQIGVGGMGVVWQAHDELLGRTVAVKELTVPLELSQGGDQDARRALREARIAARLHHPNVIGIYDVVDHERRPFLVMEYLASRSLSQLMAAGELLPPQQAAGIGAKVAGALIAAHEAGIVHRDVKPGNVLLGDDGSVKITDFGISRAVGDTTVTASGILLGTLGYIAPETAQGQPADSRSDVYALGATLYAAVEGHAPFGDDDNAVALMYRIVHEEMTPAQHAGPLEPVLLWMLNRDPALRPTMAQARRALEAIETASEHASAETVPIDTAAPPVTPAPPTTPAGAEEGGTDERNVTPGGTSGQPPRRRTRRALIGVLIAAVLLGLGGWALAALPGHGQAPPSAAGSGSSAHASRAASSAPPSASSSAPASSHPANAGTSASASAAPTTSTSPTTSQSVAAQLVSTIEDYYKLVPGNLDQAWTWMTADYQQNHAGGRIGYDSFWSQVQRVTASSVTANPPSSVDATIDYYNKNGSVIEERTRFGLVNQQGRWLIASSSVLSHQSR